MDREKYNKMLADAYDYIIVKENYQMTYINLWDHLNEKHKLEKTNFYGHSIKYDSMVTHIYNIFFNKFFSIDNDLVDDISEIHCVCNVPNLKVKIYLGKEDIYIISLKFFKEFWFSGVTYIGYLHYIKNIKGIQTLSNDDLFRIYIEIAGLQYSFKSKLDYYIIYNIATTESIFRLLEFEELQESFKASLDAKKQANISLMIAIISIILSIVFSVWQIYLSYQQIN